MTEKNKENNKIESISAQASMDKMVPKFCTAVNMGLLNSRNLVMTMIYNEGKENAAIIERIVVDIEHAKSLNKLLTKIIQESENVK